MGYCTRSEYPHRLLISTINSLFLFGAHTDLTDSTGFAFEGVKSHRGWWLLKCRSAPSTPSALNLWKFVIICGRFKKNTNPTNFTNKIFC